MKAIAVLLFFLVGSLQAASGEWRDAVEVMKEDGSLTLFDGASFFVFLGDGKFQSFPRGISGRTLAGTWSRNGTNPVTFTVDAEASWINGISAPGNRRRIVFIVYNGSKRPVEGPFGGGPVPNGQVWGGYYIIDQFVSVSAANHPKQAAEFDASIQSAWPELDAVRVMAKPTPRPAYP